MDISDQYKMLNGFNYDLLEVVQKQLEIAAKAVGRIKPVPMPKTSTGESGLRQTDILMEEIKSAIAQVVLIRMRLEKGGTIV